MLSRPRLNLRSKLIISSLLVLTPILILLIFNYRAAYDIQEKQVLADQARVAQVVSITVDDQFDQAFALANSYATDPVVLSFDTPRINSYLARLAPIYPEYYDPVAVFDANGNLVGTAGGNPPVNVADRAWFQEVMRTGGPTLSGVIPSIANSRPIAVMAVAVMDGDGRKVGAVSSVLSLDHLPDVLRTVQRSTGQNIFLADRAGTLAFHTGRPDLTWEERDASQYPPIRAAMEGRQYQSDNARGLFGEQRMLVVTPTPKYGWIVGVSIPLATALAPVQEAQRNSIIVFALFAVVTIALAWALAEFLSRPIKQIARSAVALGRGQLDRRVSIRTGDEIEELGHSFNAMADEMQRALRLRDEFLSVASHELRTPLTIIKGYSQWLLAKETSEDKRKALQTVVRQVDRIRELLDEMLTVTELQAGRVELHKEKIDLTALAKAVVDRMQMISEKHRLLLDANGPLIVEADPNQIDVVLTNLIDNAIRYSPDGGNVEVKVSRIDDEAVVSVKDYGMGIPEDKQKHVFEPFFQIQPAIAGFGGMGLGLFISKQIVDRHGGRIWFESKPGEGSTFYFSLPLATPSTEQDKKRIEANQHA